MKYLSTRDPSDQKSGAQAIVAGLAADGGLYVPRSVPAFDLSFLKALIPLRYAQRCARVLEMWLPEMAAELPEMCEAAYARFDHPAVAPVKALGDGLHVLELWHGPTLAFKDMALQLLPRLMRASSRMTGEKRVLLILVATSGDTGKAALEGFAGVEGVRICVFYPQGGVSQAQRLQMITQEGGNTRVVAVKGNFDDAQTGVKKIFSDPDCIAALDKEGIALSSANSINLGRLVPQIAYYISAYADMVSQGVVALGEKIDICVPTGNFGNILAAHYAQLMGLPVGRLVCASNRNNVLSDFIHTGVYDRNRPFHLTTSPSMDILISSNLERLLFELAGHDGAQVGQWMAQLRREGRYALDGQPLEALKSLLWGGWADEGEVAVEIGRTFKEKGYLCDPHTAVALKVARDYQARERSGRPILVASTASPYKFGRAVLAALEGAPDLEQQEMRQEGEKTRRNVAGIPGIALDDFACCDRLAALCGQTVPSAIAQLPQKPVRHSAVCETDNMWQALGPMREKA